MTKWAIELSGFLIKSIMKVQALTDFIVESTRLIVASPPNIETPMIEGTPKTPTNTWKLYTNGSLSIEVSGAGLVLTPSNRGEPLKYVLLPTIKATNNKSEYKALTISLKIAKGVGIASLEVYCDSQYVVN